MANGYLYSMNEFKTTFSIPVFLICRLRLQFPGLTIARIAKIAIRHMMLEKRPSKIIRRGTIQYNRGYYCKIVNIRLSQSALEVLRTYRLILSKSVSLLLCTALTSIDLRLTIFQNNRAPQIFRQQFKHCWFRIAYHWPQITGFHIVLPSPR